ncbi:hypothetical protein VPH35_062509 [Triticum aestivum]
MNPRPAAAAGTGSAGEVLPGPPPQRTSRTTSYSMGDPQRLIGLPGLLGLLDVAPSPGGSGSVIRIAGRTNLVEYLPAGVTHGAPSRSWSVKAHCGDRLFEIFAVYANFPLVAQVLASGSMPTKIICQRKPKTVKPFYSQRALWARQHPESQLVDFRMELPPTGLSTYIPADSRVSIQVKIDGTKNKPEELSLVLDWDDPSMSDKCNTATIETSKGVLDVVCAVISDAVKVEIHVWLCIPCELCSSSIYGSITARTDIFDHQITIFSRGVKKAVDIHSAIHHAWWRPAHPLPHFLCAESYRHMGLLLVRSFLAVPIQATRIHTSPKHLPLYKALGESKTLSATQSIILDAKEITTPWVKHGECYISLSVRRAC